MSQPAFELDAPRTRAVAGWFALALGVLLVAGIFAVALVIGRMPPFDRWLEGSDPLVFRRFLVVHVVLALVVWFQAFIAGLMNLLPGARPARGVARFGLPLATSGVAAIVFAAAMPGAAPILSNYVPAVDTSLFGIGLALLALGVIASFADRRLYAGLDDQPALVPGAAVPALRAAAVALVLAVLTFFGSWLATPSDLDASLYYETIFWGGGHVLQLASALAMVACWLILVAGALGRAPIGRGTSALIFAFIILPWLLAPRLPMIGTLSWHYRAGFTTLMQWGIFPGVLVILALLVRAIVRGWRDGHAPTRLLADPRLAGFFASAVLTLLGFGLGALIRGSNTIVPAHYHASIGGVTVAFMATTYLLLPALGAHEAGAWRARLTVIQPWLFGIGQLVFAIGFSIAGAHGMARKAYAAEQIGRTFAQSAGLVVMGAGGLVAAIGGVLYLAIFLHAWRSRRRAALPRRSPCPPTPQRTRRRVPAHASHS